MKRSYLVAALFAVFTFNIQPSAQAGLVVGISQTAGNLNTLWLSGGLDSNVRTFTTAPGAVPALDSTSLQIFDFADDRDAQGSRPYGSLLSALALSPTFYRFGADPGLTTLTYGNATFLSSNVLQNNAQNGTDNYVGYRMEGSDFQFYYGWLQFELNQFANAGTAIRFINGVIESAPNTSFAATSVAPIPEPGTWAAMAIFAGGAAFAGWRRRKSAKIAA
jgi:hypothetical protein